jgi:hypothetical protein
MGGFISENLVRMGNGPLPNHRQRMDAAFYQVSGRGMVEDGEDQGRRREGVEFAGGEKGAKKGTKEQRRSMKETRSFEINSGPWIPNETLIISKTDLGRVDIVFDGPLGKNLICVGPEMLEDLIEALTKLKHSNEGGLNE